MNNFAKMSDEVFETMLENGGEAPQPESNTITHRGTTYDMSASKDKADKPDAKDQRIAELESKLNNGKTLKDRHYEGELDSNSSFNSDPFSDAFPRHMQAHSAISALSAKEQGELLKAMNQGSTNPMRGLDEVASRIKSHEASKQVEHLVDYAINYVKNKRKK